VKVSVVGGNWLGAIPVGHGLAALLAFWSARGSALGSFRLLSFSTLLGLILRLALRLLGCGFGKGLERVVGAPRRVWRWPFERTKAALNVGGMRMWRVAGGSEPSRLRAARSCHMCDIEQRRSAGGSRCETDYHKP